MLVKRTFVALVLLASLYLVVMWGLGTRLPPADLRFGNASEPQTLDPAKMTGVPEGRIARALFEGLTYPNLRDLAHPRPGAAMRWDVSPDGLTYTFYLREDARWSNGQPVTADDFLFSWRRVLAPNTGSQYAELLWPVRHARAYNLQLIYIAAQAIRLQQTLAPNARKQAALPKGTPFIRVHLDQKEVRSTQVALSASPEQSPPDQDFAVKQGELLQIIERRRRNHAIWYKVHHPRLKATGWLRTEHLQTSSKRHKPSQARYFYVKTLSPPYREGWVRPAFLRTPDAIYPPPTSEAHPTRNQPTQKRKHTKSPARRHAWEFVGLKARKIGHVLPAGYGPSARGKSLIFEVQLERPTAYFAQLASFYSLSPVYPPLVKQRPRSWVLPKYCVGNGPFRLTHWMINDLVRVEKNPYYWGAKQVKLKSIHFLALTERDTQLSMYLYGDLDLISNNIPLPTVDKLKGRKDFHSKPYLGNYFYRFNVKQPPLDNKYVRQALSWAVDRKSIARYILRGGQRPAYSLVPPGLSLYPPDDRIGAHFSPDKARKLLALAGYDQDNPMPPVSLLYNTDQQHKQIAEALQKMWSQHLGITVHLVNKEWKTFLDATKKKEYQIARGGWIGDYPDPNTFLSMFVTAGGHNRTGWSHASYDAWIARAAQETDPRKRMQFFRRAEALLMDEAPILTLYFYNYQNLVSPRLHGHIDNPLNMFDFRLFWKSHE